MNSRIEIKHRYVSERIAVPNRRTLAFYKLWLSVYSEEADSLRGAHMNWEFTTGNWQQFKGTVSARWGKLTEDQLMLISGKREHLLDQIQEAYGIDLSDAELELRIFEGRHTHYGVK